MRKTQGNKCYSLLRYVLTGCLLSYVSALLCVAHTSSTELYYVKESEMINEKQGGGKNYLFSFSYCTFISVRCLVFMSITRSCVSTQN